MNISNRSSSNISDQQTFLPSNSYDDLIGVPDDAMDVDFEECSTSVSGSDHCDSTASISIFSDSEIPELSEDEFLEENSSESSSNHSDRGGAIVNVEQEAIDVEENENLLEVSSDSSESLYDERDLVSSSDDEEATLAAEIAREELEEAALEEKPIDGDVPFQYTLDSDDESETGSEHEEELEEATLEEESIDDERSEVGSEHSEHLEIVNDTPQYSTEDQWWIEFSDSESEVSSDNEEQIDGVPSEGQSEHSLDDINDPSKDAIDDPIVIEDSSVDSNEDIAEHNDEEMSVDHDVTMNDFTATPTSDLSAEEKEELKRNNEFLQSAPIASTISDSASSLTSSEDAEFRVFIQRTREREAQVNGQEIAVEVPVVAPDMLEEQVVAVDHALGIGNVENHLDVVIANGGIQPQLRSSEITHNWLYNFHNHF